MARVLVVDDDADIATGLAELLAMAGHDCRIARDGREALDALDVEVPALILLDLMMPRLDGFEFRKRQRAHPAASRVPVIVLTADHSATARAEELDAPVLWKPFAAEELLELVAAALGKP